MYFLPCEPTDVTEGDEEKTAKFDEQLRQIFASPSGPPPPAPEAMETEKTTVTTSMMLPCGSGDSCLRVPVYVTHGAEVKVALKIMAFEDLCGLLEYAKTSTKNTKTPVDPYKALLCHQLLGRAPQVGFQGLKVEDLVLPQRFAVYYRQGHFSVRELTTRDHTC